MPITREEAAALAELLCTIRPNWNARGVMVKGLGPLAKHPAPLEVITWAAIRAARDPEVLTPAVIPMNGPHWNLADRPTTPRLTPENECPRHVGQWAATCSSCAADTKARPDDPDDDVPLEHTKGRTAARAALDRARRHATSTTEPQPAPDTPAADEPPTDAQPCPSCQRDLTAAVAAPDCTQPDAHPAPGSLPHHYGHPDYNRAHWHRHPWRAGTSPDAQRQSAQRDAGKCLDTAWHPCDTGQAHLAGVCRKEAGHHDDHHDPDQDATWPKTYGLPDVDWCDHSYGPPDPLPGEESAPTP